MKRISPNEAKDLLDQGYVYVDVRSEPEFEEAHPAGAYNVPIAHLAAGGMSPNPDFLAVMAATFPKDARIVVGCKAGGRSLRALQALEGAGFTSVVDQRAGFDGTRDAFGAVQEQGWRGAGLPIDKGQPAGRRYADLKK